MMEKLHIVRKFSSKMVIKNLFSIIYKINSNFYTLDPAILNAPVIMENDTTMQIDDKLPLLDISDAVLVATNKLNLSPTILFQSKVLSIVENLKRYKNVI